MQNVYNILDDLKSGPTILTLNQIVCVSESIQSVSVDELAKNKATFFEILNILVESYYDSAIFEINNDNKHILGKFVDWLFELSKNVLFCCDRDDIVFFSEMLSRNMIGWSP